MRVLFLLIPILLTAWSGVCQSTSDLSSLYAQIAEVIEHNPDSALSLLKKAETIAQSSDSTFLPHIFNRISQAHSMKGDYATASSYSFLALKKATVLKDTAALIDANNNLGIDLMYQDEYKEALAYFYIIERLATASHDTLRLGHALNNIGLTLGYSGNTKDEIGYYERAAALFKAIDETEGYANTLLNRATVYTQESLFEKAEQLYREALTIYESLNYTNARSMVLQSLSENALNANNNSKALAYAYEALTLSRANGFKTEEASCLQLISAIHRKSKKYDSALFYLEMYNAVSNEIFNAEKKRISSELEARYQTDLKEQQIVELQQAKTIKELEAASARQWQIGLLILLILLFIVALVLFNRYQLKQRTAKTLNEKNTELQKLNRFKDRMFAVISHDLRNPVNAFSTLIESLHQNVAHASKEELQEFLGSTLSSANDLKSLLNNLLEWALVQIGRLPYQPASVEVLTIVTESMRHTELMAIQKKIIPSHTGSNETVYADKAMVIIIVRNLLTNAIKFSKIGGVVEIHTDRDNGKVTISVRDNGIGIHDSDIKKLFTTEASAGIITESSAEKGAGIGLLLCKELVEKNNGRISVISKPGEGSIFTIELPAA